jgi:hypothetical protein
MLKGLASEFGTEAFLAAYVREYGNKTGRQAVLSFSQLCFRTDPSIDLPHPIYSTMEKTVLCVQVAANWKTKEPNAFGT